MNNPFAEILDEVKALRGDISKMTIPTPSLPAEIIDRKTLCSRLNISQPTAIKMGKRGELPEIRIGDSVRFNWQSVLECIERKKKINL